MGGVCVFAPKCTVVRADRAAALLLATIAYGLSHLERQNDRAQKVLLPPYGGLVI